MHCNGAPFSLPRSLNIFGGVFVIYLLPKFVGVKGIRGTQGTARQTSWRIRDGNGAELATDLDLTTTFLTAGFQNILRDLLILRPRLFAPLDQNNMNPKRPWIH